MFKILENLEASCNDMGQAVVDIEAFASRTREEAVSVHSRLVLLQQKSLSGKAVGADLETAKGEKAEMQLNLDACESAISALKTRMAGRIHAEAQARKTELHNEYKFLTSEKTELLKGFLEALARAVAAWERIEGVGMVVTHSRIGELKEDFPTTPKVEYTTYWLTPELRRQFLSCVNQARSQQNISFVPVEKRQATISNEITRLDKVLSGQPEDETEKLLASMRPKVPKKQQVEGAADRPRGTTIPASMVSRGDRGAAYSI